MLSMTQTCRAARSRVAELAAISLLALIVLVSALRPAQAGQAELETAMDAVLVVRSNDAEDIFLGSAFLWGEEAVVAVTNAHVVGKADEVRLIDRHGNEETGIVIARDEVRDIAVISLPPAADGGTRRGLVPSDEPAGLGLEVFALGAPLGIEFTLTEGLISATARQVDITVPMLMLQHDAAVNPGSSGGPLVDAEGRLLGMNSQIADGSRMFVGIAYAITAPDLDRIVTGLIDETQEPFPSLGLKARPVDRKVADALGVPAAGLLVDGVERGGLADAAGILPGDIILAVDGKPLAQPGDFVFAIEAAVETGMTEITVGRAGAEVELAMGFQLPDAEDKGVGVKVRDLSAGDTGPDMIKSYRLGALGVVLGEDGSVTGVTENSPALYAGLAKGDRILAVNGEQMDPAALDALEITAPTLMLVQAPGGQTRHIYLDPWGQSGSIRPVGGANVLDPAVEVF